MNCSDYSRVNLSFSAGIPSPDFFEKAWASEQLTNVLTETNIPFALPEPDSDISLVAKHEEEVIGQCSTNRVLKYWNHVEKIDSTDQNLSTQIFVRIHKKAVETEKKYLEKIGESIEKSFHSAGIAVLTDYRGKNIGLSMRAKPKAIPVNNPAIIAFRKEECAYQETSKEGFMYAPQQASLMILSTILSTSAAIPSIPA